MMAFVHLHQYAVIICLVKTAGCLDMSDWACAWSTVYYHLRCAFKLTVSGLQTACCNHSVGNT